MRVRVNADDVGLYLGDVHLAGKRATTLAMRAAAQNLKGVWRRDVAGSGLGRRLGNTIRSAAYPQGTVSMGAAALIWTNAPKIIAAHETGPLIRSKAGFYLAIPTDSAGVGRGGSSMTPLAWEQRNGLALRMVFRRNGYPMLVADDARLNKRGLARRKGGRRRKSDGILTGAQTVPIFILLPQVKLRKRLNLLSAAERVGEGIPGAIVNGWRD